MNPKRHRRLLIVEDDEELLTYLCRILGNEFETVGFTTGEEGVAAALQGTFPVAILDMVLGRGMSGMEVLKCLQKIDKAMQIIILTGFPRLESAMAAVNCRVFQYVIKPFSERALRELIRQAYLRYEKEATMMALETDGQNLKVPDLSPREQEVVVHVLQAKRNTEVAKSLGIKLRTVERHMENIFSKLNISSRLELILKFRGQPEDAEKKM